jgi:hypothetical protein
MAKVKAKVGIYKKRQRVYGYGYDNPDLISEERFEELVADRKEQLEKDDGSFEDYLADNYSWKEVFDMSEDEKAEVRAEYADKCVDWARDDLEEDWDYEEIETEVEIPTATTVKKPKAKCPCPCNQF